MSDPRIAQPGDEDLDIDVDGVTLLSVVAHDREVLMRFVGGFGMWVTSFGDTETIEPGEEDTSEGECLIQLDEMPENVFDHYVSQLAQWRDRGVPLRLCGAPGRPFTLIEDRQNWLPLPRDGQFTED